MYNSLLLLVPNSHSKAKIFYHEPLGLWDLSSLLLLLLSCFSHVWLCVTPYTAAHQAPCPWNSPGKNTGVGCHFLLQCMKVKSESKAAQSCPTQSNPMDCSLPGSSIHGIFQQEYWNGCHCLFHLVPWPRIKPGPSSVKEQSTNHWAPENPPKANSWSCPQQPQVPLDFTIFCQLDCCWITACLWLHLAFVLGHFSCVRLFVMLWTGSSVQGILQARILEWVAMPFSRGSSQPRDCTLVS